MKGENEKMIRNESKTCDECKGGNEKPEMEEELLELISLELTCSICHGFMTNPSTIICGHTFCASCISRVKPNKHSGKRCCPLCRTPFHEHGEVNVALKSVLKLLKKHGFSTSANEDEIQQLLEQQMRDSYTFGLANWYVPGVPVREESADVGDEHTTEATSSIDTARHLIDDSEQLQASHEEGFSSTTMRNLSPTSGRPRLLHLDRARQFVSRILESSAPSLGRRSISKASANDERANTSSPMLSPSVESTNSLQTAIPFPSTQEQISDSYTYGLASEMNSKAKR